VINKYLVQALKKQNLWNADILNKIKFAGGSIQDIHQIPAEIRARYKEVFEIDARWIIEAAARRGKWIDQSQSLNIFYNGTSGRELSEIYFYAWKLGLKTTYYLRSLGASQVEKATVSASEFGSTHTRTSSAPSAHVAAAPAPAPAPAPVAPAQPSAHVAGFASAPMQSLAEKQAEAEKLAAQLARVAAGDEVGLCESCQG
ncbi:ribonucleoside-diphosphate reductase subunit alpha, partial [Patescibacteria group bacterium]|nr:ribonucleoside-diphosphate reductase subunit alpha [Patescibacteria group bacterium]